MQIYAYDKEGEEIAAHFAKMGASYWCPDCHSEVRVRSGPSVRPHFFHLKPTLPCRLHQKTPTHLAIQSRLLKDLPEGEAFMEKRFPSLNRIADLVWEKEKLVFEIQVSFITAGEVEARSAAYRSLNYEIVWVLHDHRFNHFRITAAERALLPHPHYFTSITAEGSGGFFDQFSFHCGGTRAARLFRRPVDLAQPRRAPCLKHLPSYVVASRQHWKISFKGDLLNSSYFNLRHLKKGAELQNLIPHPRPRFSLLKKIKDFFRLIGYLILDASTH